MKQFAAEANQKCGVVLNLEQLGLLIFFVCFFNSSILEKQDRGEECRNISDADMKNCSDRDRCSFRNHIHLLGGNSTGGGQFNIIPIGSSAS